jgi:C-terminal peptidase prc
MKTKAVMFMVALVAVSQSGVGLSRGSDLGEVFVTGDEQAIINRFLKKTDAPTTKQFSYDLDHTIAVLLARANPTPDVMLLARAAVVSRCTEYERQTRGKIGAARRDTWVSDFSRTRSFKSVLDDLAALEPKQTDQPRLIEAGLNGMLRASGWDSACVLPQVQADEIKRLMKARETPAEERGVLGLNLERWPVVGVAPGYPAAKAGVKTGDAIVTINSNEVGDVKTGADGLKLLEGPPSEVVKLMVKREDRRLTFEVMRISAALAAIQAREVAPNVLLVTIPTFEGPGIAAKVKQVIHSRETDRTAVVILDLRDNGGGRPEEANGVADIFLDGKLLQIIEFRDDVRIGFKSHPGAVGVRTILLTNKGTASSAEMLAMSLHDHSTAVIVGESTAGMVFGKDWAELKGGRTIIFRSEPTVLSPAGHDYSLSGIPPDARVRDERNKEHDAILVRALELALNDPVRLEE